MAVLTLKSAEYKTFPAILREYASYTAAIKGNSEKTVCEYLLDLRTFFRFMKLKESGEDFERSEFEKISISDITIEDIKTVTPQLIIEFLMHTGIEMKNSTTTRMRKLSSLKSLFHYLYGKKRLIDSNPTSDIDHRKRARLYRSI